LKLIDHLGKLDINESQKEIYVESLIKKGKMIIEDPAIIE